jgi:hypothetical protein
MALVLLLVTNPVGADHHKNGPGNDAEQSDTDRNRGGTVVRPPQAPEPPPSGDDTPRTTSQNDCRITARFGLEYGNQSFRFHELEPGFDIDARAVPNVVVEPVLDYSGRYPGRLQISVNQAGRTVPITKRDGTPSPTSDPFTSVITLGDFEKAEMEQAVARVEREIEAAGSGFYLQAPGSLGPNQQTVTETVVAKAAWRTENGTTCEVSADIELRWKHRHRQRPKPLGDKEGRNHLRGSETPRTYTDSTGEEYVVIPIYHYWEVTDPYDCCGERGPYQVVQFARVLFDDDGNEPPFQKGHAWALDIRESEKLRARNGDPYDPTFTNDPRGTNPGGSMVNPAPGGQAAVRQEDAPGMTRQRYNELVAARKKVVVTWQFVAFLVCPPEVDAGENPAEIYLAEGKVCRVAIYEVVWTFPGAVGAPPAIAARLKEVYRRDRQEFCEDNLTEWLQENDLVDAYRTPPEARAIDLDDAQHRSLKDSISGFRLDRP